MNDTARYPAIIAELNREFTRWATEDLANYTCEDLANEGGAIDKVKWAQLGYTLSNLDAAYEELTENGKYLNLPEHVCDTIANELGWNHDKLLYAQLKHAVANGFTENDIALWRSAYGWSNHAQKLLARADRASDALNPRNATVDLGTAVKISFSGHDATPAAAVLIQAARAKHSA